jgi:O-antigen ligase
MAAALARTVATALALIVVLATYRGRHFDHAWQSWPGMLVLGRRQLGHAFEWFGGGFRGGIRPLFARLVVLSTTLAVLWGSFAFLSQKNYFRRIWESSADSIGAYILDINAGSRSAYAFGALQAYFAHPLGGVGLGASGHYIYENLPDWSLTTVSEIARQLSPDNRLYPNPKNLYVRLLAESGLPGLVLYSVFQMYILGEALSGLGRSGFLKALAVAGFVGWLAIAAQNVTQDSLASPNMWLIPGMLASGALSKGRGQA